MMKRLGLIFLSIEFFVWLIASVLLILWPLLISYHSTDRTRRTLIQRGRTTSGTLIAEKDHGQISYSFVVEGRRYDGISHRPINFRPGASFEVFYDPANPSNNTTEDPNQNFESNGSSQIVLGVWLAGILAVLIRALGKLVRSSLGQAGMSSGQV